MKIWMTYPSASYSYDIIIDVDMNEDVNESKQITEGQVEASELVMAAKSMVDKYDQIIKTLVKWLMKT